MFQRLATQMRKQLNSLVDQYDARLRTVPGYANLPQTARRDLEQRVLQLIAECLEANDDSPLVQYIHERAEQVLAHGFQPEWFQQAVTIPQDIITPLVKTVAESNFVWRALGHAQTAAGEIVAHERRRVELTLRESEARYQTIFDATPIMFWLKDAHNRTLRINKAAAEFEGVNPADVEGKSAYDLYPREQAEAFYQDDLEVMRSNQPKLGIVEEHTSVGTGKPLWVETGKTPVHNDQGEVVGVLAFGVDVTGRRQAEEILRHSAEQQQQTTRHLRAALEAANELIRTQDLNVLYRRTVELAREKFDIERCGLFMMDESREKMWGTYGTDDQRQTTDERGAQRTTAEFAEILTANPQQLWVVRETPHSYVKEGEQHIVGAGWVAGTVLRGAGGPIGIFFNDRALSGRPVDEAQQEALAIYCSIIGSIVERKRAEEERRAALENERITSERLRAIVAATDELIRTNDLETLYRRAVELAREKIGSERCALYILDESREWVLGTYGTDEQGCTTDEHTNKEPSRNHAVLTSPREEQWIVFQNDLKYWEDNQDRVVGTGWNVATAIRSAVGPIGIMFNDAALSGKAYDESLQQALALYCTMLANIIENKRLELQIRQSLQQRDVQVQTSTEVAQEIAAATDLDELFKRVVTLIKERFNYYHTQLFRYEPAQEAVVLITGYGEIGQKMLAVGHKLQMGRGVVGTAAATGKSILASDVRQDADWRSNPYLPDTRGELAVPIKWRDQVLGILDVQSDRAGALGDDDRLLLEGLCGQIASALESTRLLEQLRRNEAQLSEALKIAKLGYWEYDVEKDLFQFNDQFYSIFHTTAEQAGGYQLSSVQYAQQFVHPDDLSMVGGEIERALNSTDRHYNRQLEHRVLYADGGAGYISVNVNIDRDEQGKILRYYGANQDITQSKLAEQALRQNETQLSEALKIAKLGYWEYDVEKDLFHFNDQFYAIFHTTAEQAGGYQLTSAQYAQQFVHPDDLPMVGGEIERALNSTDRHYSRDLEHRILYADGGVGYISVNINIERDEHGHILRYYGANQDITDSKLAEQEFSRFKQGLEQASDAVFMTDVDGHIIYINPAFERIYGYSRAEALGQTPRILKSGQLSQEFYQNFWQTLLNKQSISGEKPNKTKDGRVIVIEDSNSPILDSSGHLLGFLSTHRDITERKQAEQRMAETLRETERLYAAVGHESWQAYRQTGQQREGYLFNQALLQPADKVWEPEMAQALEQQALITSRSAQRAVAVSPLAVRGEAIGALGVYDDPAHPLSKDDLQLIEAVSEQVALALESARLFDQTQIALADTRALFRFSDLASRETEIKPIYDNVAQLLVEETGFAGAWIAQVDTQAQVLRGIAGAGAGMGPDRNFDVIPYQHMQTPATIAARDRVMIVVNDPLHDERLSDLPQQMKAVIGKAIAMPVIIDGEIESIIAATRPADGLDIGERDQRLLQTAAAQVASAIQRARLFEQTQRDAEREHTINRVTSRIRNARSVDEVLSIAAQELRLATQASRSMVEILPTTDQPVDAGNGEGVKA